MSEEQTTLPETNAPEITPDPNAGKLRQTVEISDVGPCKKHVKIVVNGDEIAGRFKEKFDELLKDRTTHIPGFRPGKAPRKFVERKYHDSVKEDVRREVLMASLQQLADDSNLSPLAPPQLDPDKLVFPDTGDFTYEFDVEVRPEFELGEYKGMKIRRPIKSFGDADIADAKRRLLLDEGKEGDKGSSTVEKSDFVDLEVSFWDGDRKLSNSKTEQIPVRTKLVLVDGTCDNFAEKMIGAKLGETRTFTVKLGETTADADLAGKEVTAKAQVNKILGVIPAEMNAEFLERFGVKSEAHLDEVIVGHLERRLEYHQRQVARSGILQDVTSRVKFDLPRDLVIRQASRTLQRRVMELRSSGFSDEEINARAGILEQNVLQSTAISLMEHFILQKVAELEKIEINDEDIDSEIHRLAMNSGESFRRMKSQLEQNEQIESLATELLERKALDVILNNAVYEEYPFENKQDDEELTYVSLQAVPGELRLPQPDAPEGTPAVTDQPGS